MLETNRLKIRERIELRCPAEQNAEEIFNLVTENYEHLRPFLHWVTKDYALADAREFIERNEKNVRGKTGQTFAVFRDGKIVGMIGFVDFNWSSRRTEIGYWLAKNCEGEGIVTDSCKALLNYAFRELGMNRVELHCATENERSCAVAERLNFKLEGVLRQSEWRHTRFLDMAIYGLLAEEWKMCAVE